MTAGNDIVFTSGSTPVQMIMSDASLSLAYTLESRTAVNLLSLEGEVRDSHGFVVVSLNGEPNDEPLHYGDTSPVNLQAGGDIEGVNITVPKAGMIEAGGDIGSLVYFGQNVGASDVTRIVAGGNITYSYGTGTATTNETIELGGPGELLLQAGGNIDLGNTIGITTIGNSKNGYLGSVGASIIVAAGVPSGVPFGSKTADQSDLFSLLHTSATQYTGSEQAGDTAGAQNIMGQMETDITDFYSAFGATHGNGDITMTSSQISTNAGGELSIFAAGKINVGLTVLNSGQGKNTGIYTARGGDITIYANGDVNVNESRIMTFQGGDITIWSDNGNINAGKGAKNQISTAPPVLSCDKNGQNCVLVFTPPSVGSGIRALTYAPNLNTPAPPEGNISLFAPKGVINAGEAGISGNNVTLEATSILNANNISFSGGSVGVPAQSTSISLGALAGTGEMSKGSVSADTGALGPAQDRVASAQPIEDMIVKWIDVKVVSYDLGFSAGAGDDGGPDTRGSSKDRRGQ